MQSRAKKPEGIEQLRKDFPLEGLGVLRTLAGAFQFSGDGVDKLVRVLSGGEDGTGKPVTYGGTYEEYVAKSGHEAPGGHAQVANAGRESWLTSFTGPTSGIPVRVDRIRRRSSSGRGLLDGVVARYLDCGIFERGFARIRCPDCAAEYLLAFITQPRGIRRILEHLAASAPTPSQGRVPPPVALPAPPVPGSPCDRR